DGAMDHRDVQTLGGIWSFGVNDVEIELNSRIEPRDDDAQNLLTAPHDSGLGFDVIAFRRVVKPTGYTGIPLFAPTSQLIVVANGSYLVNLQLVNKEHR